MSDRLYNAIIREIDNRVEQRIGEKCKIVFSAYAIGEDDLPVDNLDEVPIPGSLKIVFESKHFGNGMHYESPILNSPTWLDLCVIANEIHQKTQLGDHYFFEDMTLTDSGIATIHFGS